MTDAPKRPRGLKSAGRELWDSIVPTYTLRPDELRILADACREADLVADMEAGRTDRRLISKGSQGQDVIDPLISELRQHRAVIANLLKSLKLPDSAAGAQQKKDYNSDQARAAARARWGTPKGA